jgi:SAM-dependent methyltransferase
MNFRIVKSTYRDFGLGGLRTLMQYLATRVWTELTGSHRECPICGWQGREFRPTMLLADGVVRARAICPRCHAWERHRLSWLYFTHHQLPAVFQRGADVIFMSPDAVLEPLIRTVATSFRKSSYEHPGPSELQLDLQDLTLQDESVDAFVMNSVLASVADLGRAVASMHRVLRPGGVVVSCEFLHDTPSVEYEAAGYGAGRRRLGRVDLANTVVPFEVGIVDVRDTLPPAVRARYGLKAGEYILVLQK